MNKYSTRYKATMTTLGRAYDSVLQPIITDPACLVSCPTFLHNPGHEYMD